MRPEDVPATDETTSLDRYLDDLLAGRPVGPTPLADDPDPHVDVELERAARAVSVALARFHPSFRFEERLATRLRDAGQAAAATSADPEPQAVGVVIPFSGANPTPRPRSRRVNGALIGGAISAGVSIASLAAGALVARRRGRGDTRWERVV